MLVADLLHLLTAVGCERRSGAEAGSGSSCRLPRRPSRGGPAHLPQAPAPRAVWQAWTQDRVGRAQVRSASQPGVRLEADVTGLTSPALEVGSRPQLPNPHPLPRFADRPPGLTEAPPLLERPVRGHLAGPAGRAGRDSGAGRWLRYRGAGAPHLARKGSGAHAEPSVGGSGR